MSAAAVLETTSCTHCRAMVQPGMRFCQACGTPAAGTAAVPAHDPWKCAHCGGDGRRLPAAQIYCPACRWLRPLGDEYDLPLDAFIWQLDAEAMAMLRSIGPLTTAAHSISDKVGRPWLEAAVSGVRVTERQLPDIFTEAVAAARALALPRLPEFYVSGQQMWEAMTLGTDHNAVVVLGSVLTSLKGADLRFVIARELGHVRAGHALWKTVMQLLSGRRAMNRTILGDGVMQFLNPAKLLESAIDAPLMAWSRHAEITADRAGLLVVGDERVAERVLMQMELRSFPLVQRLDLDEWRIQEAESDDETARASEATMSSTPYIGRRLKLMRAHAANDTYHGWRAVLAHWEAQDRAQHPPPVAERPVQRVKVPPPSDAEVLRLKCPSCQTPMRVPRSQLAGRTDLRVRCPNAACGAIASLAPRKTPKPRLDQIDDDL